MVFEIEKARIERGFPCMACGKAILPSPHFRASCPACKQVHVVPVSK